MEREYRGNKTRLILVCVRICSDCDKALTDERQLNNSGKSQSGSESDEGSKLGSKGGNWPTKDSTQTEDLIARSDTAQLRFVRTELGVCHALTELATREDQIGDDQNGIEQALGDAEAAYETARQVWVKEEILSGLRKLRIILDRLALHETG